MKFEFNFKNPKSDDLYELFGIDEEKLSEKMNLVKEIPINERVDKNMGVTANLIVNVLIPCTSNEEIIIGLIELGKFLKEQDDKKAFLNILKLMDNENDV